MGIGDERRAITIRGVVHTVEKHIPVNLASDVPALLGLIGATTSRTQNRDGRI